MSGNHRMDIADITQSNLKGEAMLKAIDTAFDDHDPHPIEGERAIKNNNN